MNDLDDINEAIEIALGNRLSGDSFKARTVDSALIARTRQTFRRILSELSPDATVHELLEAFRVRD